jgi:hypothetical protein
LSAATEHPGAASTPGKSRSSMTRHAEEGDVSSQTDEWMAVTGALESCASIRVIHVPGRSARAQVQVRLGSKRARGGGIKNALLGPGDRELDPHGAPLPRRTGRHTPCTLPERCCTASHAGAERSGAASGLRCTS